MDSTGPWRWGRLRGRGSRSASSAGSRPRQSLSVSRASAVVSTTMGWRRCTSWACPGNPRCTSISLVAWDALGSGEGRSSPCCRSAAPRSSKLGARRLALACTSRLKPWRGSGARPWRRPRARRRSRTAIAWTSGGRCASAGRAAASGRGSRCSSPRARTTCPCPRSVRSPRGSRPHGAGRRNQSRLGSGGSGSRSWCIPDASSRRLR
mmetsp:Transcript_76459/g.227857  ORF Transcript_76459/g.227857 Transcript_76459/m.227857 type:complete len:208 (+) Transcript_76459:492-1115(+)